ncbi:hypothetical protein [Heyndrickxia acidicola]|uniref:Stress-associated endoplasmic reticulum protein n=1 Tax=Heyndrickxia acidicola TaxID=209389 RepID=A0ABU6MIX4_9BACI|nr:hypothetical protein [Heyndrickxia acidicola]MED1204610.1 hypothetical protein [Heyndrickxia acidicola]
MPDPEPEPIFWHPDKADRVQGYGRKMGNAMTDMEFKLNRKGIFSKKTGTPVMPKEIRRIGLGAIGFLVLMLVAAIILNLIEIFIK